MGGDGRFRAGARGLTPVVGAALMVTVVVLLALTVASMVIGFGDELRDPAPSGGFDRDYVPTGADNTDHRPYVVITHQVGRPVDAENVVIRDDAGNEVRWDQVWTGGPVVKASEHVHVDGFGSDAVLDPICEAGDGYRIVLETDEGEALLVNEWEAPTDPQLPPDASSDADGDGIPDWC